MLRRARSAVLLAFAAALVVSTAWHGTASGLATVFLWLRAAVTVVLLAGLPLLVRRRLGPVLDSRLARSLRIGAYAATTALIVALADLTRMTHTASRLARLGPHNQPSIGLLLPWSLFLLILACYLAVILAVTAQRCRVTPSTLAIGTGTGLALGIVMYAIMPLGFGPHATAPWLRGSAIDPVVVLGWILLLGGPLAAALLAGRRWSGSGSQLPVAGARIRQGIAAGVLAALVGSLLVCALGPATIALLPRAGWLVHLLYPGQRLTAAAVASLAANLAGNSAPFYLFIWFCFPVIGLGIGSVTGLVAWARSSGRTERGGSGPRGPEPGAPASAAA